MDLAQIFDDLLFLERECSERRLIRAAKWASELTFHISRNPEAAKLLRQTELPSPPSSLKLEERMALRFGQSCIDNEEYQRAAHCTLASSKTHPLTRFVHYYAKFLAGEKAKADNMADVADKSVTLENDQLTTLHAALDRICATTSMEMDTAGPQLQADAYILYLYGLVLKDLGFKAEAMAAFIRSLNMEKRFWPSWQEAARLVASEDAMTQMQLPDHWMKDLFVGEVYLSLQSYPEALQAYLNLCGQPDLGNSPYILTQMAIAHHHLQDTEAVVEAFRTVRKADPYRLDHVDLLSNSLFVKTMRPELAELAHHCTNVAKYSPETCLVVGNYYSVRGEHDKAVIYFQRALKLDPRKADAWTLLGHEFMELKNTAAATLSYRKALEIDPHDYRAWYGLGQHYDILKMPNYAMYYYNMAQKAQPTDSRVISALGEMYEKLNKHDEARKCYWKAHLVGDGEGQSLVRLGKLYEKMKNADQAAAAYHMYLVQCESNGLTKTDQHPNCYRFLADYLTNKHDLDGAHDYAQKCLEFDSTKEEARGLLRRISQLRGETNGADETDMQVEG